MKRLFLLAGTIFSLYAGTASAQEYQNSKENHLKQLIAYYNHCISDDVVRGRYINDMPRYIMQKHGLTYHTTSLSKIELGRLGDEQEYFLQIINEINANNADEMRCNDMIRKYNKQLMAVK